MYFCTSYIALSFLADNEHIQILDIHGLLCFFCSGECHCNFKLGSISGIVCTSSRWVCTVESKVVICNAGITILMHIGAEDYNWVTLSTFKNRCTALYFSTESYSVLAYIQELDSYTGLAAGANCAYISLNG